MNNTWIKLEEAERILRYDTLDSVEDADVRQAILDAIDKIMYAKYLTHK